VKNLNIKVEFWFQPN